MAKTLSRFYFLSKDKKKTRATLFVRVQDINRRIDAQFTTHTQIDVEEWLTATSSEDALARHRKANPKLHDMLGRIEILLTRAMEAPEFDKDAVKQSILEIADPEKAEAKRMQKEAAERAANADIIQAENEARAAQEAADKAKATIWNYLDKFCKDIATGKRLNGNDRYSAGTVKAWNAFSKLYTNFDRKHEYTWDMINREFVSRFLSFMERHKYMVTAQNKYLVTLRALTGYAYRDGIHDNDRALMCFAKKKIKESDKAVEIFLSEAELQALYEMKLTGLKEQVRDLFLVGCYTCQRVSDYTNIAPESFTTTARGTKVIRLVQQKTKTEVKIPIMNPNLHAICEKYNYKLPYVIDVLINRYIKEILKDLSETVPSLAQKVPTKLTMKQREKEGRGDIVVETDSTGRAVMPRYNCVTTHTARRSGITNMYLSHKYTTLQMMHVSGHKTEKTFRDYIKLSSDEIADEIDAIVNKTAKQEVF